MTRTVSVGDPGPDAAPPVTPSLLWAQQAGRDAVARRRRVRRVDQACREIIDDAGWGDAFVHGTGHGVGLEIHEDPRVAATPSGTLAPGHVVTVEPGVYLPGVGGVRIEDTVVVTTRTWPDALTEFPKDLDPVSISTNDLKNGMALNLARGARTVVEFQHVKPGKGGAFVRTKLKNVRTGAVVDKTFRADEKVEHAVIDKREMQYLYREGNAYVFMDNETYDQLHVESTDLGPAVQLPQGGRRRRPAASTRAGDRHRPAGGGGAHGGRDRARRPGRPGVGCAQAGDARDRARRPGAAVHRAGRDASRSTPAPATTSPAR